MSLPALRPLSNGEILDGAFTLYRRNFVVLVGTALLFTLPSLVLVLAKATSAQLPVNVIASIVMVGALVHLVADATLGRPPNLGRAVGTGFRKFLPMLLNFVIYGFLIALGMLAVIVGSFLVAIMGFAIAQVVVIENRIDGFARSRMLAKKSWGRISILLFLAWIITFLPSMVLMGGAMFASFQDARTLQEAAATPPTLMVQLASLFIPVLTTPFSQCVITLLYFDQRVRKEGLGIELQAAELARPAGALPGAPSTAPRAG